MTSKQIQLSISYVLYVGLILCLSMAMLGGFYYLIEHGREIVSYHAFYKNAAYDTSVLGTIQAVLKHSSRALVQLSLVLLVVMQILRVGLTVGYFITIRDKHFIGFSLFIFLVMVSSLFINF
jgi:uncharacterized membrane protein